MVTAYKLSSCNLQLLEKKFKDFQRPARACVDFISFTSVYVVLSY